MMMDHAEYMGTVQLMTDPTSPVYKLPIMDGEITREELCAFYTSGAVCAEKFTYFDQNGDGYIVVNEFVATYE
jgi:hypothetical protein